MLSNFTFADLAVVALCVTVVAGLVYHTLVEIEIRIKDKYLESGKSN
jgi:hypothetical protein